MKPDNLPKVEKANYLAALDALMNAAITNTPVQRQVFFDWWANKAIKREERFNIAFAVQTDFRAKNRFRDKVYRRIWQASHQPKGAMFATHPSDPWEAIAHIRNHYGITED